MRKKERPTIRKKRPTKSVTRQNHDSSAVRALPAAASVRPASIVGIGASAGGLEAFDELLTNLPLDTGMAFVLVQHLAAKSILPALLSKSSKMPVVEVRDGMQVLPDHVYVIPPNMDMRIAEGALHLAPFADRARRMPIDTFLRSLAEDQQGRAIGIILSGTASDGTLGLTAIKAGGGLTFAQDVNSAKYNAMPRNAAAGGNVDFVLPPALIARELKRIARHIGLLAQDHRQEMVPAASAEAFANVFNVLLKRTRVDFSLYKPGTLTRRITRRMFLRKIENLEGYAQYLRKHPEEIDELFNDILINVTGFFRDPETFEALRHDAFPALLKQRIVNAPIRVWVPGCSTGEEPYSLAMALMEYLGEENGNIALQIFATDVSEAIIQKARAGIYPENIAADMSADRLQRFFNKVEGGYQISKTVRDLCVFAKQDVAKDPPFSRLDMISCRNVMIYMGPTLQRRIIPLFHYALNPGGILFLGSSESVGTFHDLFTTLDKKFKIYSKRAGVTPHSFEFVPQFVADEDANPRHTPMQPPPDLQKTATQMLLNRYAPSSVVVNEKLDILQFIGQAGRFLEPSQGQASLNLLRMVKSGLQPELRTAFQKIKGSRPFRREGVLVEYNGELKPVNFEILPVKGDPMNGKCYLVVFEDPAEMSQAAAGQKKKPGRNSDKAAASITPAEQTQLQEELEATRDYLQSIIEEQRTTNEELRSANEEIQSSNEELQSINEELETAKEELQSTNEELTTVNEELQNRNDELTILNSDLTNLLSSVHIPILMLGGDLRVRRFTPMAEKLLNLIPGDLGRPITDIKPNLKIPDLRPIVHRVIERLEIQEVKVEAPEGRRYLMKVRPYRTVENKIDGVVIVFLDLDSPLKSNA
jgi:two-component system, chemotaxis family, CheB/CheR fusion protein